jgi:hypothetical protein
MRVSTLLVAEGVSVDVFTGRVTAFNLVETLFAVKFPARVTRLHGVVQYERPSDGETPHFFQKLELVSPAGADILNAPVQELTIATRFHTSMHHAWNVQLSQPGDYRLRVSQSESENGPWRELAWRTIVVEQAPHPLIPPSAAEPAKQ